MGMGAIHLVVGREKMDCGWSSIWTAVWEIFSDRSLEYVLRRKPMGLEYCQQWWYYSKSTSTMVNPDSNDENHIIHGSAVAS